MSKYIKFFAIIVVSGIVTLALFPGVQSLLMPNTQLLWEVKISNTPALVVSGAVCLAWLGYIVFLIRR